MDRLDAMRLFVRVIDRRSFTAAAADLDIPRSTATEAIRRLERQLGSRLLERTTRHVAPTLDGEAYYRRCLSILADIDEAEGALRGGSPSGVLRIDAHGALTRAFLLPRLPEFLKSYPQINLHIGQGDRLIDLVREGVDCVIRAGDPHDSSLIMRRLPDIPEITCASPHYIERHGMPASMEELAGHQMIGFVSSRTRRVMPLEFQTTDGLREITLPCRVSANEAETAHHLARMGFGLIQAPRYRFREDLARGALVEILPDMPPPPLPLAAYYPQNRQLSPRVRVFLDWTASVFEAADL
ncbi:DNA-binding transcriptional LysR family regulator [Ochrobactrum daejeonense]|uniref:DNA-binding transcriptional LysR family regulator n=1 Tax=Brucella daejeonensis TaxID=659015 RepID=A0A7W9AZ27_9HYPH|nr:LysR family transcriptional regulator [Brucella daejeonensis]MBB5703253.1 DNA-binding transcriptional LysR family regulator [Brucella daejeonensis]